jgi:hypothetical protein
MKIQVFWNVKDTPLRQNLPTFRRSVASSSSGSNSDKKKEPSIQNYILNANIFLVDLFLLEEDMIQIGYDSNWI